jgi:small conductance mechanosensitive channel
MEDLGPKIVEWGAFYGTKILGAAAILIIGRIAVAIAGGIVKRLMNRANSDATLSKFVVSLVVVAAVSALGIQTASFIAVLGAVGLAIGFALQGSLSNFAAGVMLIIFRPIRVGDYVEAGGTAGTVEEIHIFNTYMKSPDNRKIIVPNSKISSDTITNYSAHETRRIDLVFGIGYGDDIKKARDIINEVIAADDRVLSDPAPTVAVSELADSSVNFVVRPWVKTADYWAVRFDLTENVKLAFDRQGVSIPFPQRDVHLFQEAG